MIDRFFSSNNIFHNIELISYFLSVRLSVLPEVTPKKYCLKEGAALCLRPQESMLCSSQGLHKTRYEPKNKIIYSIVSISYTVKAV